MPPTSAHERERLRELHAVQGLAKDLSEARARILDLEDELAESVGASPSKIFVSFFACFCRTRIIHPSILVSTRIIAPCRRPVSRDSVVDPHRITLSLTRFT